MRLKEDCLSQLETVINSINSEIVFEDNKLVIEKSFSYLYILNYLANKVELKRFFDKVAFNISYSCLIESFILLLQNHPRGSALVLRSALENFLKCIIEVAGNGRYTINDRSYSANQVTVDILIENEYPEKYHELFKRTNAQMYGVYGKLSGLSHSITPESQNNLLNYFSDSGSVHQESLDTVFKKYICVSEYIFQSSLFISRASLEIWERDNLEEVISFVFGKKRMAKLLILLT